MALLVITVGQLTEVEKFKGFAERHEGVIIKCVEVVVHHNDLLEGEGSPHVLLDLAGQRRVVHHQPAAGYTVTPHSTPTLISTPSPIYNNINKIQQSSFPTLL